MVSKRVVVLLGSAAIVLAAAAATSKEFTPQQRRWWAFQSIADPAPPAVKNKAWVKTPIDAFVLSKLEDRGIQPNTAADKVTLLRRATLDLTGLPPTTEETHAFTTDDSPGAFAKVVDRLLASPHYGERWARHWLDLARYSDSEGFKSDETRPNIWRYRDYVIESFNQDKPYDRFVREQLAGDELYPQDSAALIATGFNRHFPDESNAANIMQRRQELLNDITDTVGSVFLGMTYGCARCHDHKFDPILHKDYYRLQAFFANLRINDDIALAPEEQRRDWERRQASWLEKTAAVRAEIDQLIKPRLEAKYQERFSRFPAEIQEIISMPSEKRTSFQWHMFHKAKPQLDFTEEEVSASLKGAERERHKQLKLELAKFDDVKPEPLAAAQGMLDNGAQAPKTNVLAVGVHDAPMEEVEPGFLSILDPTNAQITRPPGIESSGRRTALAKWIASPDNPLTARVMANRVWHYHFGRGIAATPSDFGVMGERPTHRELLDWLSSRFIAGGWSIKKLHREIMLSSVYQQSSTHRENVAKLDPENKLFWKFSRRRLEGESLRDSMLYTAGRLNAKMGGPGVFPPLPPGVITRGGWKTSDDPSESDRRSVYVFVRRNTRYPMFEAFDMPDTHESCARRNTTVTPGQSLELLNNELVYDWARSFAARVANDSGLGIEAQVDRAWKLAYARTPTSEERTSALRFLERQRPLVKDQQAALIDLCHMLLSSNEFLYLN